MMTNLQSLEIMREVNERLSKNSLGEVFLSGDIVPYIYSTVTIIPSKIIIYVESEGAVIKVKNIFKGFSRELFEKKLIIYSYWKEHNTLHLNLPNDRHMDIIIDIASENKSYAITYHHLFGEIRVETVESYIHGYQVREAKDCVKLALLRDNIDFNLLELWTGNIGWDNLNITDTALLITRSNTVFNNITIHKSCLDYFTRLIDKKGC